MADDKRPEGLETKDTRGTLLGYIPAESPHVSRTGAELSDKERDNADVPAGTPHAGAFDDRVAESLLGQQSDSPEARRVGEGRYPAEGPAAPARGSARKERSQEAPASQPAAAGEQAPKRSKS